MSDLEKEIARETAKALRHDPDALGLSLTEKGWVTLEDLHYGFMESTPHDFDVEFLRDALETHNRRRFQFEGDRVRALAGHTTSQVRYDLREPPEGSFYLTFSQRHHERLSSVGITQSRQKYTKVFPNPLLAYKDAKRRRIKGGILVSIDAQRAYHDGTLFYYHGGDWYVTEVDSGHLSLEELTEEED